jgi:hypothetical protein
VGMTLAAIIGPVLLERFGSSVLWKSAFGMGAGVALARWVMGRRLRLR